MLKKLVKYDLIWVNKFMLIYFTITLIVSLITRILSLFNTSYIINIIYLILRGCAISCYVSCLINCVIRIWARFIRNVYKDESYLTHTLPVSKQTLYNSKIVSSILSILITIGVILICFIIAFLNKDLITVLKTIFNTNTFIPIGLIIIALLEVIYLMYSGIIGTLIGHKSNNHKVVKSVFFGILIYFTIQITILILIYILGLFNASINYLFTSNIDIMNNIDSLKLLIIIVPIIYLIFITTMYFIGKSILKKGVNIA